jgi:hypothetical protein
MSVPRRPSVEPFTPRDTTGTQLEQGEPSNAQPDNIDSDPFNGDRDREERERTPQNRTESPSVAHNAPERDAVDIELEELEA